MRPTVVPQKEGGGSTRAHRPFFEMAIDGVVVDDFNPSG
jgi:hypothetical protein